MISGDAKVSTTGTYGLAPLQVWERAANGHCTFMASHMKCMVKILIGRKYCVSHLNKKILKYF